MALLAVT